MSFKTLNKDIKLFKTRPGRYDRMIEGQDFKKVDGVDSLRAAVVFQIMLISGELSNNPTYKGKGNKTWFVLKDNNNALNRFKAKEYTKEALESMRRIDYVDYVDVEVTPGNPNSLTISFGARSIDDTYFTGDVTVGR